MSARALETLGVRTDVRAWFEMHGCILDKKRRKRRSRVLSGPEVARLNDLRSRLASLTEAERDEMGFLEGLQCNKMQREIGEIIQVCRERRIPCRIVTLKGRQQGSSTISVAAAYHELRRRSGKCCIIGDEYDKSVKNLVKMFADYAENDTFDWGNTVDVKSKGAVFSHGSELITETANDPRAGASGTMQVLIKTEVAHWPETGVLSARAVNAALLNCVPEEPDTLIIDESTPNGAGGVYYETYMGAMTLADYLDCVNNGKPLPENWNGYFKVSYFWHEHPEYNLPVSAAEGQHIMATLTDREAELIEELNLPVSRLAWRRKTLKSPRFNGDEERFEQEFPADEVRCFLLSGRRAFPLIAVQKMKKEARGFTDVRYGMLRWADAQMMRATCPQVSEDEAMVKIFEIPRPGFRYVLPVDPAAGKSQTTGADPDNHGAGIIRTGVYLDGRWYPPKLAARLADCFAEKRERRGRAVCQWDIAVLIQQIAMLARYYGNAMIIPEMNQDRGLMEGLQAFPGLNLYRRRQFNRVQQKPQDLLGWMTTVSTRGGIIENLKRAIRMRDEPGEGIEVYDQAVIGEMETMIVTPAGKEEAMGGCHDDQVMMLAIGLANLDTAVMMPFPTRGRQFGDEREGVERRDFSCT